MNEELFRKKSLEKIKSPESLDDYIRVTNPGVWLLLVSIIVLLAGACVWGCFGHIDSIVKSTVTVENGNAVCFVKSEDAASIKRGQTVKFGDTQGTVTDISPDGEGGVNCTLETASDLTDGIYEGKAIVKSYKPISFILN